MDVNKLREMIKNEQQKFKKVAKTVKPKPGSNRYRILPGWRVGEEWVIHHMFGQHFIKNEADEVQAVYMCMYQTYEKPCPICDSIQRAIRMTTDDDTVKVLEKARAGKSVLLNALDLDSDDPNTPIILEVRPSVFEALMAAAAEWGEALFAPEGNVVTINREGKGLSTKYTLQVSPKTHTIPKAALEKLNNLDEYVKQESEDRRVKAISAVNSVAGLLTSAAPMASAGEVRSAADIPKTVQEAPTTSSKSSVSVDLDEDISSMLAELEMDEA